MIREVADNLCQHNLCVIGNKLLMVIGFIDSYSSFYTDKRVTDELILHDENAKYDNPNRWWRYRYFRLCRLPFKVRYRREGSNYVFKVRPQIWIRLNRIDK